MLTSPNTQLKLLLIDPDQAITDTLVIQLQNKGYYLEYLQITHMEQLNQALSKQTWNMIILNVSTASIQAEDTLEHPNYTTDTPLLILANETDEDKAIQAIQQGAHDYILVNQLKRLLPTLEKELRQADIRKNCKKMQQSLRQQAYLDQLTGVSNRVAFFDRLQYWILKIQAPDQFALCFLDLNRFKAINDNLGHHYGDLLLQQVATRLKEKMPEQATLARVGGDEFAVLLPYIDHKKLTLVVHQLLHCFQQEFYLNQQLYKVSVSIGISLYPRDGKNIDTLIKKADIALYDAKQKYCGFAIYQASMYQQNPNPFSLSKELKYALQNNHLELYYQPKMLISNRTIYGAEALLRWHHREHGLLSPDTFIPIAEQSEMIGPLTLWVIETALNQIQQWQHLGLEIKVAVNLSVQNLMDKEFQQMALHLLQQYQPCHKNLELELTETTMMSDPNTAMGMMRSLTQQGIQFSIDDFGTGYSSLNYLKKLPVKVLKIDKSFITDMAENEHDAVIVRATIDLAHNLGLQVVAEGIEDESTWNLLEILRCDLAQGYYISPPLPANEFYYWIQQNLP